MSKGTTYIAICRPMEYHNYYYAQEWDFIKILPAETVTPSEASVQCTYNA